jgi:hypothetical protein
MMPARPSAPRVPPMTPTRPCSVRSCPSRVTTFSPGRFQRTMTRDSGILARSNACVGWPISIIT